MTIGNIQKRLLYYFDKAGLSPDFQQGVQDESLSALNEARLSAEQQYAFELNKRAMKFSSVLGSVDWMIADGVYEEVGYQVRSIKTLFLKREDGGLTEIPIQYKGLIGTANQTRQAYLLGTKLVIDPAFETAVNLQFDGYVWMPNYTDPSDTDWMVMQGHNYLFWAALYTLNHRFKEFVPRQEGNLTVGADFVQAQFAKLVAYDSTLRHGATTLGE